MMRMKVLQPLALASLLAIGIGSASAQTYSLNWNPRSGDVWVDARLSDMNYYGNQYREPFINEMVGYYGAPRDLITDLLVNRRWAPGDVYYACTIAQIIGRPCGYVADYWQEHHGQGWGVVAQRLGIKPGSAEFHRLKKGFVPTYDRWSRPITLDADLRRAYPDRVKPAKAKSTSGKPAKQAKPTKVHGKPAASQHKGGKQVNSGAKANGNAGKAKGNGGGQGNAKSAGGNNKGNNGKGKG